jgi:hypothetical protein
MAIENCSISNYSSPEGFGDNYGEGEIASITCSIIPNSGFTVAASDFSWIDVGVTLSNPQPTPNQYRYQSDLNGFSYNLSQPFNMDDAPAALAGNPVFSQNTVFPKYVIFRNSTQSNALDNVVIVDVVLWDEFTMPNADVGMRLDINGVANAIVVNPVADPPDGTVPPPDGDGDDGIVIIDPPNNDDDNTATTTPTYGSFSMGVIFAENINGTFISPASGNQLPTYAGNASIEPGLPYSTKWDQRVVGSDSGITEEEGAVSGAFAEWAEAQVSDPMDKLRVAAPYYYAPFISVVANSGASSSLPNYYWGLTTVGGGLPGSLPWWFQPATNNELGYNQGFDYVNSPFNVWPWMPSTNGGEAIPYENNQALVSHLYSQDVDQQLVGRASFGHIQINYFGVQPEAGYSFNQNLYYTPSPSMDTIPGSIDEDNLIQNIPPRTLLPSEGSYSSPNDLATNYFRPTSHYRLSNGGSMKMTRRPNYLSNNPGGSSSTSSYITWDGRRTFGWVDYTGVDSPPPGANTTINQSFQIFRGYDQVRYYRIKAVNGYAINKNLFKFPQGLDPQRGYITGQITKKALNDPQIIVTSPSSSIMDPAPLSTSAQFNFGPWAADGFGGSSEQYNYNGGLPISGSEQYYFKTLFQGNQSTFGIPGIGTNTPDGGWLWNNSELGNNLPSIIRYPAVYLSSDLSTKRYDIIDYIELQNGINYNPGAFFEGMSQNEIDNNIGAFLAAIYTDQLNYSMWENNEVEIRIKFNPDFQHSFQLGDGYFEDVEIIIPIQTNPISSGPIIPGGPNVPFTTTVSVTGGTSSPGGITVSNGNTTSDNVIVGLDTNKRGEVGEEQVLTYRGFTASNKRANIGRFDVKASTGKYFSKPPVVKADNSLSVKTTSINLSNIDRDENNRVTSYSYDIKYKNKVKSSLGDKIKYNVSAETLDIPVTDGKLFISGIDYGRDTISINGGVRPITITGDPGADFKLELNSRGITNSSFDGPTILKSNTTFYKKLEYTSYKGGERGVLIGKLNKAGVFSFNATFPKVIQHSWYYIVLKNGDNSLMRTGLEDKYILNQYANGSVRIHGDTSGGTLHGGTSVVQYSINDGGYSATLPEFTGRSFVTQSKNIPIHIKLAIISLDGSDITQKGGAGAPLFLTSPQAVRNGATLNSDWENSYPSENGGGEYDIINQVFTSGTGATANDMYLDFDLIVKKHGTENVTLKLDLNNFLAT